MLKKIRKIIGTIVFVLMLLLFLDFTGTLHLYLSWLAKIQLVPAILAVNVGVLVFLGILTLLFGRIYCSTLCPLGLTQDGISQKSDKRKNRFQFSKAKSWLRYGVLAISVAAFFSGVGVIVSLLDPYAGFGRIVTNLLGPLYRIGNNILAFFAETIDSYVFYSTDVWIKSWAALGVALLTLAIVGVLAWRSGRTWCNTICPAGTLLGLISRFSLFRPTINTENCTHCGLCEKGCKASCIDSKNNTIDMSRCVTCFDCIENCNIGAIKYIPAISSKNAPKTEKQSDDNNGARRSFMAIAWAAAIAHTVKAQQLQVDGGLTEIKDKTPPERETAVIPPGSDNIQNLTKKCTACHLCISNCPNNVLRPSRRGAMFMQPEMFFERGYCRPECVECSLVCPSGAISKITKADKTDISIGRVVINLDNCIITRDNLQCNSCQRKCPTEAIILVDRNPGEQGTLKIPTVENEKCIGCGACEYYCPARPFSAIYVEGHVSHHKDRSVHGV